MLIDDFLNYASKVYEADSLDYHKRISEIEMKLKARLDEPTFLLVKEFARLYAKALA